MVRHAGVGCTGCLVLACLLFAMPAHAQKHEDLGARPHKGILVQAGAGLAYSAHDHDWGLSLPSLTVGTYVRRNLVMGAHFAGTTHLQGLIGDHPYAFMMGFYGPMVQLWWDDLVYLGIAVGLDFYSQRNTFRDNTWADTVSGFGLALKGAMSAYRYMGGRLNVFVEVLPAVFGDTAQVGVLVGGEWQYP